MPGGSCPKDPQRSSRRGEGGEKTLVREGKQNSFCAKKTGSWKKHVCGPECCQLINPKGWGKDNSGRGLTRGREGERWGKVGGAAARGIGEEGEKGEESSCANEKNPPLWQLNTEKAG